ncbi:MAG TPA: hypothetical protein PK930_24995 [Leptospiraceae bacterium]|nr:hypothetical protein [Leptospiraceae bacterium]
MKYLLFVNFANDLKHNSVFETIEEVIESAKHIIKDEELNEELEKFPETKDLINHLNTNDDFLFTLSNGTWFPIQSYPVFSRHFQL